MNDHDDLGGALDDLARSLPPLGSLPQETASRVRRGRLTRLAGSGALVVVLVAAGAGLAATAVGGGDRLEQAPFTSDSPTAVPSPTASPASSPAPPDPSPSVSRQSGPQLRVVLQGDGLGLVSIPSGTNRMLLLTRTAAATVRTGVDAALGPAEQTPLPDCGARVVQRHYDGLTVTFDGQRFVGWSTSSVPGSSVKTADGIGVGATLAELRSSAPAVTVTTSSLGREFNVGNGLFGILQGGGEQAVITFLAAGNACVFR